MTSSDWILILLAFLAIGSLVVLVTRVKINAFIALLIASLIVGGGAVLLGRTVREASGKEVPLTMLKIADSIKIGAGNTLGGIAAIIALGTMLGKLLAESGGAEVLAKEFIRFFGPHRIQLCIMALALAVGLTTWFAVGLVLLLPILLTLTQETRQPFLRLALPLLACLSVMHGVMPPHPGPVLAVDKLNAQNGLVLLWGFIIGLPTAAIAGPIFARWAVQRVEANPPPVPDKSKNAPPGFRYPGFKLTLLAILLPVMLMLIATVAELSLPKGNQLRESASFIGNATTALLISVLFGLWALGTRCGYSLSQLLKFTEQSVASVGMTLVVIGGGGAFARVLTDSGVAEAIGRLGQEAHLSPLLYGWLISAFIRVATGSATVAITTASGLLAPIVAQHPELTQHQIALIICAVGCGSLFLSHLNDGGFWIVRDCLGLTVGQTLRTWTVCETIVGIAGMLISLVCYHIMAR